MSQNQNTNGDSFREHVTKIEKIIDLDDVLVNELGQFGWFQFKNILLVSVPIMMSAFMSEYIFSAASIPHRCKVPECGEDSNNFTFNPEWISNAIPETSAGFSSCFRFVPTGINGSLDYCPDDAFNTDRVMACESFVYDRDNSVVYDFDLGCQEWMRALAGTLSSVGTLLVLPVTGYFSDRFGRRLALVVSIFNVGLFGLIRAFSTDYAMYLVLQLLQTTLGAGTFSSGYVFATELVGPKYRVIISALIPSLFAVGLMILGSVAWAIHSWRYMILALHIPCFLIVSYYWCLGESVRWLLSKQKYDEARAALEDVARVNKTRISEKSMEALLNPPTQVVKTSEGPGLIKQIFRSPILLRRVCTTPIWWIATTFVYYGLSINSTGLSDAMYLNFILTCAIEIPGNFAAIIILTRIGRKFTLSTGFFLSAACNITFAFLSADLYVVRLLIYLLGKFSISMVMTSVYLFTSELYPTEYRHSLLAFSSMIGRIGSISAPLTPALMEYWAGIPSVMFGVIGIIAGLLIFTQPETLGTKLPDTLAEAEALGKPQSKLFK
ncbi:organic cation transporter protein-like [Battus philenor]|uniref:organic cation transporter protein-like n=1 Tax=Battus philenor TaxID=42288 RepID=UPI0035CF6C7E